MKKKYQVNPVYVQVGCVYVLSSDDIDMIHYSLPLDADWFWELLESRRVQFPNPYFESHSSQKQLL